MTKNLPPIIAWDESWSVGVTVLDEDHKHLVQLLQRLFGVLITSQNVDDVARVVQDLLDYTEYHFRHEETLLADHHYPELEDHKACHKELLSQVQHYCNTIQQHTAGDSLGDDVYEFLKHWLVDHILDKDLLYKPYLM